jgi:Ni/Co efflux regulator RcnB
MLKKWTSFLLMFLVLNLAAAPLALAQTNDERQARAAAKIKEKVAKIGTDKKITVRRQDKTEVTGYLSAINSDSFSIDNKINGTY